MKKNYGQNYREYIGIAADEVKRIEKERTIHKLLPLVDWNMTEADCLNYCYSNGYLWIEEGVRLYDILDRVSCWCCGNKNSKEMWNICLYLPQYYRQNIELLKKIIDKNKQGIVVEKAKKQLEKWEGS